MKTILEWVLDHLVLTFGAFSFAFVAWKGIRSRKKEHTLAQKAIQKSIATHMNEPLTLHPEVDLSLCVGCGSCTKVCPEGDILKLINHKSVLVSPSKCVGHGECETACPMNAITLVFGTKTRGMDIPRISANYETNVPGLYIAGELGGMGLIRNAIKQGVAAAKHALKTLPTAGSEVFDLLIVGAGPAGLGAALASIDAKKKYLCIDQNTFGGTVANFPKQKLVMSAPAELPLVGAMKFAKNKVSKEDLLEFWHEVKKKTGFQLQEKVAFISLEKVAGIFEVKTSKGLVKAKKVILAMGVRGSPRKLGLPNEDLPKVAYNLVDPEEYQGRDICVVGGGNAGVEAAQYLARASLKNRVRLLVRGEQFDRCNDENKRIIEELAAAGLVTIQYSAAVKEISKEALVIEAKGALQKVPNDYLFVFAGADLPSKFLMSLGISIDKKFGEAAGKPAKKTAA